MNVSPEIKIKIFNRDDGALGVKLTSADSDAFGFAIAELKSVVPVGYRRYEPSEKIWLITGGFFVQDWFDALRAHFDIEVEYVGAQQDRQRRHEQKWQPPRPQQSLATPYKTLHLLPDAPPEVVKAAYKALARIYHPDLRGDTAKMVEINRAYETLSQDRRHT
jgi:hypothetical protein